MVVRKVNKSIGIIPSIIFVVFLTLAAMLNAEEGMFWTFPGIDNVPYDHLNETYGEQLSEEMSPEVIQRLTKGVVRVAMLNAQGEVAGHGSGSFVSPNGLVYTNHHVAYDCVEALDHDLAGFHADVPAVFADDYFFASTEAEEHRCPNYAVIQTVSIEDVSDRYFSILENDELTDAQKVEQVEAILTQCQERQQVTACSIDTLSSIQKAQLVAFNRYDDVRLVYAPSKDAASLGGDNGNFNPGTRADFAFLRVYETTGEGVAAQTSPLETPDYFKSDISGTLADDDFMMVLGYPGSTVRLRSSFSIDLRINKDIPLNVSLYGRLETAITARIQALENGAEPSTPDELPSLRSERASISNTQQRYMGFQTYLTGEGYDIVAARNRVDAALKELTTAPTGQEAWVSAYGSMWSIYEQSYGTLKAVNNPRLWSAFLARVAIGGSNVFTPAANFLALRQALDITESQIETLSEDEEGNAQALAMLRAQLQMIETQKDQFIQTATVTPLAQSIAATLMDGAMAEAEVERIPSLEQFVEANNLERRGEAILNYVIEETALLESAEERARLFRLDLASEDIQDDPMIALYSGIENDFVGFHTRYIQALGPVPVIRTTYYQAMTNEDVQSALAEKLDDETLIPGIFRLGYDDANSTLRMTYGQISSVDDAVYNDNFDRSDFPGVQGFHNMNQVNLDWIQASPMFGGEQAIAFVNEAKEVFGETPVNLLATLDTTGGNSGSPALGKDYRLIGTLFDGNRPAIAMDYAYDEIPTGRSVVVAFSFSVKYLNWDVSREEGDEWSPLNFNRVSREIIDANETVDEEEDF